jgi:hypothetical protein
MKYLNVLLIALLAAPALAEEKQVPEISCVVEKNPVVYFKELQGKAEATSNVLCKAFKDYIAEGRYDVRLVRKQFEEFSESTVDALSSIQVNGIFDHQNDDYNNKVDKLNKALSNFDINDMHLPNFDVFPGRVSGGEKRPYGEFSAFESDDGKFYFKNANECGNFQPETTCKVILEDFEDAFNPYRSSYKSLYNNEEGLETLRRDWDRFLEVSKSQTSIEVWLTTLANRSHFKKNHLVGPPPFQIIAFHPNMIYNSLDKAGDGSQMEYGLGVEWVGINFWDKKIPFGLSATSIYVDREEVKDVGHGIQFHIYNKYSVGWAKHGGQDSFYVTIDLLKLFSEKHTQYEKYVNNYF